MRRIVLTIALILSASSLEAAPLFPGDFFTPDYVRFDIIGHFDATGSTSFCWQCADFDPTNDFRAALSVLPKQSAAWRSGPAFGLGSLDVRGPAADLRGLNAPISFYVTSRAFRFDVAQPSVATGVVHGRLVGVDTRTLFLSYTGRVDGVSFREGFTTPYFDVPPEGASKAFLVELDVAGQIVYTPPLTPIPEPTSLLLLGPALAAAALRRRRAKTDKS